MREIVLDTETTGLDPAAGNRIVEIGCVELENHLATGRVFHKYINPERDMPEEAFKVHGLSEEFLSDKPVFADVARDFVDFIGDAPLVIHNAEFDMKFLNWELKILGMEQMPMERSIDTVKMARKKFPGSPANLDALCRRFGIDNSARDKHGALLDAELLAEVYLELIGGREPGLSLLGKGGDSSRSQAQAVSVDAPERPFREPRPHAPSEEELAAHTVFLGKVKNAIWLAEEKA
ncbi:MAG TPA: DNA polymerase III subunit epsilon [Candidatus Sulfotelmatobacter sp.]|jgi:DNA polymerase-3 subunit epsilon|nr:DNA polymerase III subunit epsilon [Candidatus Sulfotelmatobacter sp.]